VPVIVVRPGIVTVRVPVLVVCDVIVPVGPAGEVEFEKEDDVAGEPSVEDELPPVGTGRVTVYVVPIEIVTLLITARSTSRSNREARARTVCWQALST
jgi:hypothetical protein